MHTRAWKVYGADGHRQKVSFEPSKSGLWVAKNRRVTLRNSDITGTNEYSVVIIDAATEKDAEEELLAQLSDGIFENARVGKVEEIEHKPVEFCGKIFIRCFARSENNAGIEYGRQEAVAVFSVGEHGRVNFMCIVFGCEFPKNEEDAEAVLGNGLFYRTANPAVFATAYLMS